MSAELEPGAQEPRLTLKMPTPELRNTPCAAVVLSALTGKPWTQVVEELKRGKAITRGGAVRAWEVMLYGIFNNLLINPIDNHGYKTLGAWLCDHDYESEDIYLLTVRRHIYAVQGGMWVGHTSKGLEPIDYKYWDSRVRLINVFTVEESRS
ncbi:hypothetical protein [Rhizobium sp. RAF56]|uniref:hypothetical protein n=1 Tax=Rhizobium sp. RAF56 TaxID=3233062 RepID=UPI003F96366D